MKGRIIDTAREIMFRYGIKRLNMDDLASRLGISKKTLYRYFSGKKELVRETIGANISRVFKEQDELLEEAGSSLDKINAVFIPIFRILASMDPVLMKDLIRFYPDLWQELDQRRQQRLNMLKSIISEGVEQGVFMAAEPDVISNLMMVSLVNFINPRNLTGLGISPVEGFQAFYRVFFMGIIKDEYRDEIENKFVAGDEKDGFA